MLKAFADMLGIHVDRVRHAVNYNWMNAHERVEFLACVSLENPSQAEAKLVEIKEVDDNAICDYTRNLADNEVSCLFDDILQGIQKRYNGVVEDEDDEHHDLFAEWLIPTFSHGNLNEKPGIRGISVKDGRHVLRFQSGWDAFGGKLAVCLEKSLVGYLAKH